jgi:uncharacterized membrane protein YeaQ/YmgE (transglycosylase-associated protein family)
MAVVLIILALVLLFMGLVMLRLGIWVLSWVLVGLIAGWIAAKLTNMQLGVGGTIAAGIAGSLVGGLLAAALFHVRTGGALDPRQLVVATIGAVLVLGLVRLLGGEARHT